MMSMIRRFTPALVLTIFFVNVVNADIGTPGRGVDGIGVPDPAGAGSGDVVGPSSSVDSEFALFNSTTGKLIKRASGTGVCKATSGVASFAALLNADVSASAAIDHSKMAALTASRVMVTDASGVASASSVTTTTLGYVDPTSSIQTQLNGKLGTSDNAVTATALAANPADCSANTYATTISATGSLTCASITNASTTATSANTASAIVARDGSGNFSAGTITAAISGNATTATALAANPAACSAGQYVSDIAADGTLTCGTPSGAASKCYVAAYRNTNQSYSAVTENVYIANTEITDGDTCSAHSTTTGLFTVPSGHAGDYMICGSIAMDSTSWTAGQSVNLIPWINGGYAGHARGLAYWRAPTTSSFASSIPQSCTVIKLAEGDTIGFIVYPAITVTLEENVGADSFILREL